MPSSSMVSISSGWSMWPHFSTRSGCWAGSAGAGPRPAAGTVRGFLIFRAISEGMGNSSFQGYTGGSYANRDRAHSAAVRQQAVMTIFHSLQPHSSRWWWKGAILKNRLPWVALK